MITIVFSLLAACLNFFGLGDARYRLSEDCCFSSCLYTLNHVSFLAMSRLRNEFNYLPYHSELTSGKQQSLVFTSGRQSACVAPTWQQSFCSRDALICGYRINFHLFCYLFAGKKLILLLVNSQNISLPFPIDV